MTTRRKTRGPALSKSLGQGSWHSHVGVSRAGLEFEFSLIYLIHFSINFNP